MAAKDNVYTGNPRENVITRLLTLSALGDALNSIAQEVVDRAGYGGPRGSALRADGTRHQCPWCQSDVFRVRRRLADRFASVLSPRQRYRCTSWSCRWEGTLRVKR